MPLLMEAARYKRVAEEWRVRAETTAHAALKRECEAVAGQYEELARLALSLRPPSPQFATLQSRERERVWTAAKLPRLKQRRKRPGAGPPDGGLPDAGRPETDAETRAG